MQNTNDFLDNAAKRTSFTRERYQEKNIPTNYSSLAILPFFGDIRSHFVLSTLLLHRFKEDHNKYLILASYPGYGALYPCVDEFWGVQGDVSSLWDKSSEFSNNDLKAISYEQHLNRFFENLYNINEISKYYKNGLTKEFFDKHKVIVYDIPSVGSSRVEFNRQLAQKPGFKVMFHPTRYIKTATGTALVEIGFWVKLAVALLDGGYVPVVYQNAATYNLQTELKEQCVYINSVKMDEILASMRTTGCVLDVFNDLSRFAIIARCPFVSCAERRRYSLVKEYELDDLCAQGIPHQYIFTFTAMIETKQWQELADSIVAKLDKFLPQLDRDNWLPTAESSVVVPYSLVRQTKTKRIGTRFIRVPKI